jgi:hypothetical protein
MISLLQHERLLAAISATSLGDEDRASLSGPVRLEVYKLDRQPADPQFSVLMIFACVVVVCGGVTIIHAGDGLQCS